jgi:hypothetical protein
MIRIWADFNARDGTLRFTSGSLADIRRQNVDLKEGLHVVIYDDMYQAEATVVKVRGDGMDESLKAPGIPRQRNHLHSMSTCTCEL